MNWKAFFKTLIVIAGTAAIAEGVEVYVKGSTFKEARSCAITAAGLATATYLRRSPLITERQPTPQDPPKS